MAGCSHGTKRKTPELSRLFGKKVALVDVEGEDTARSVVEVALVNQLLQRGSFELVSKQAVDQARSAPEQKPGDFRGIAQRAGADFALQAKVLQFDATTHQGYSNEKMYDSELAAERGEKEGNTERLFKVKSLEGKVMVELDFTSTEDGEKRTGIAEQEGKAEADERSGAAHLPPKLRFLEKLANEAFRDFFDRYN